MSAKKSATAISPLMKQLAGYIAAAPRKALRDPVAEVTKHHALDTVPAPLVLPLPECRHIGTSISNLNWPGPC